MFNGFKICHAEMWPPAYKSWNWFLPRGAVDLCACSHSILSNSQSFSLLDANNIVSSSGGINLPHNQFTSCQAFCILKWCYLFFYFSRARTALTLNVIISLSLSIQAAEEVRWRQFNQAAWRSIWCPGEAWRRVCAVFQWVKCPFF